VRTLCVPDTPTCAIGPTGMRCFVGEREAKPPTVVSGLGPCFRDFCHRLPDVSGQLRRFVNVQFRDGGVRFPADSP
jgi:hypothetical protein